MPELNSNRANDFFQDELSQVPYKNYHRSYSVTQADRFARRCTSLNGISEVDMSNDAIFEMVVSSWGLHPSLNQLPLEQDNGHISDDDLFKLLSTIAPEQLHSSLNQLPLEQDNWRNSDDDLFKLLSAIGPEQLSP